MSFACPPPPSIVSSVTASWLRRAWLAIAAAAVLSGCRSATSTDLVERELRQQEDQIYALQDYLAEYQQRLCEYREENESLKRQLVNGQVRNGEAGPPRDRGTAQPTPPSEPPLPPLRNRNNMQPEEDESLPPGVPPLEFQVPDIPPLEETSSYEHQRENADDIDRVEAEPESPEPVVLAAAEEDLPVEEPEPPVAIGRAERVTLRGEVSLGDAGGGPRVLVDVEPLSADGEPAEFRGNLSLMILDNSDEDNPRSVARWDFSPNDLARLVRDTSGGALWQFPLQLPQDVPTRRPVELWVRLLPEDGTKILGHAALDLGLPGRFASTTPKRRAVVEQAVRTASVELPAAPRRSTRARPNDLPAADNGWQIARPGQSPSAGARAAATEATWRTATQPIPVVESRPTRRDPELMPAVSFSREHIARDIQIDAAAVPQWSPERFDDRRPARRPTGDGRAKSPPVDHIVPPPGPTWSPNR